MALKKREFTPESGTVDTYVNTYKPKLWRWFAVVWSFFNGTPSYRRIIVPNSGGDLWWFAVVSDSMSS